MVEENGWDKEKALVRYRLDELEEKLDKIIEEQKLQAIAIGKLAASFDKIQTIGKVLWFIAAVLGAIVGYVADWLFRLFSR